MKSVVASFGTLAVVWIATPAVAQGTNMGLLGQWDQHHTPGADIDYNDVWGYVDEFGQEYALLGVWNGVSILNVTDPANIYETGFFPGVSGIWRDMKTYADHAYVVNETGGGMQILDLTDPENPTDVGSYQGLDTAHNLFIDEATGLAYACGANVAGTPILDLSNPVSPVQVGAWTGSYVHDLYVRDGRAYLAEIYNPSFVVLDVTDPANLTEFSVRVSYPDAFTHNAWPTDDGNYLLTTDELTGGHVRVWDLADPQNVTQVGEWISGANSIVHNVMVEGDYAYASWYGKGVLVADISDPTQPREVGVYDTSSESGFRGAWGVYPFLPSGHILASDTANGLFVVRFDPPTYVSVDVTDATDGLPVSGAEVELVEAGLSGTTSAAGSCVFGNVPSGNYTLRVQREGYLDHQEGLTLDPGGVLMLDVTLTRVPGDSLSGTTWAGTAKMGLGGAELSLMGTTYQAESDVNGHYLFPHVPYGVHTLVVTRTGFGRREFPVEVVVGGTWFDAEMLASPYYDTADTDEGWILGDSGDTATKGQWIRAVPIASGGGAVQPGQDATPDASAGHCFVTANAPDETFGVGAADVDGGTTTLISPPLDASGMADPWVAYQRWYVSDPSGQGLDPFVVSLSGDDGQSWITVESIVQNATPWTRVLVRVADFVTPSSALRLRFVAQDVSTPNIVEALVDDVELFPTVPRTTNTGPSTTGARALLREVVPNPFNPRTELRFELAEDARVSLEIVDARGRRVRTLVDGDLPAGRHLARWDGRDAHGRPAAGGVYLAILEAASTRSVRKLTLLK